MNEILADKNLTTADIASQQRTAPLNQNSPNQPDLSPNQPSSTQANVPGPGNAAPGEPLSRDIGGANRAAGEPRPTSGSQNTSAVAAGHQSAQTAGALFAENELRDFRARWDQAQGSFVDEPRKAVEQADGLVANVVHRIAEQFANERAGLEKQWDRGDDVSTEDLRQALKRYRAFFDRLLSF